MTFQFPRNLPVVVQLSPITRHSAPSVRKRGMRSRALGCVTRATHLVQNFATEAQLRTRWCNGSPLPGPDWLPTFDSAGRIGFSPIQTSGRSTSVFMVGSGDAGPPDGVGQRTGAESGRRFSCEFRGVARFSQVAPTKTDPAYEVLIEVCRRIKVGRGSLRSGTPRVSPM